MRSGGDLPFTGHSVSVTVGSPRPLTGERRSGRSSVPVRRPVPTSPVSLSVPRPVSRLSSLGISRLPVRVSPSLGPIVGRRSLPLPLPVSVSPPLRWLRSQPPGVLTLRSVTPPPVSLGVPPIHLRRSVTVVTGLRIPPFTHGRVLARRRVECRLWWCLWSHWCAGA